MLKRLVHIVTCTLIIKRNKCTNFSNLYLEQNSTCFGHTPAWHVPFLCVQWKPLDDGQGNCPKHVEFYSKNEFEKWVPLVGFIIRIYHKAQSPELQISYSCFEWLGNIFFILISTYFCRVVLCICYAQRSKKLIERKKWPQRVVALEKQLQREIGRCGCFKTTTKRCGMRETATTRNVF